MSYPTGQLLMSTVAEDESLSAALRIAVIRDKSYRPTAQSLLRIIRSPKNNTKAQGRCHAPLFTTHSTKGDPSQMQEKRKEVLELKKLLTTTRLTKLDRQAIEARIEERSRGPSKERQRTLSPYLLVVFDRPIPAPTTERVSAKSVNATASASQCAV